MYYSEKSIVQADFYKFYKDTCIRKNKPFVEYQKYCDIINDFNILVRDKMINEGERLHMPYRMGELYVQKFESNFDPERKNTWKINWPETNKVGQVVYFESKYGYKWKWDKKNACFKGRKLYTFRACRKARRLIPDAINNKNLDFYS